MSRIQLPPIEAAAMQAQLQAQRAEAAAAQMAIACAREIYAPLAREEIQVAANLDREPDLERLRKFARLSHVAAMAQLEPFGLVRCQVPPKESKPA